MWSYRIKILNGGSVVKETTINEYRTEMEAKTAIRNEYNKQTLYCYDNTKIKFNGTKLTIIEGDTKSIYTIHYFKAYYE